MKNEFENEILKHIIENNVEYIQFRCLLKYPEIKHAYILKSFDRDFRVGKDFRNIEMVKKNLQEVSKVVGIDYEKIIRPDFDHTNQVAIATEVDENEMPNLTGIHFKKTDGLITQNENIAFMATNADCNLLLIYDPVQKVIANIHAGWRGTFSKIVSNAIQKMKEEFNSNPEDIICCFCPSIRKCHFEVDEDVANQCKEIFSFSKRMNEIMEKGEIKEGKQKYYIDTVLINKILLKEEGILEKNIVDSGICSICHSDKIHSRRAEGINFGLGCSLIERKN